MNGDDRKRLRCTAIAEGLRPPTEDLQETLLGLLEHAQFVENAGYHRLWLTEHESPLHAYRSPELLVGIIAERTRRLRVGTAGILIADRDIGRVVNDFRVLGALYGERIDCGVVRGPCDRTAATGIPYEQSVLELMEALKDSREPSKIRTEVWIGGSSKRTAILAGMNGASFCVADFLTRTPDETLEVADAYYASFIPSEQTHKPQLCVALSGVCGHARNRIMRTDKAKSLYGGRELWSSYICYLRERCDIEEVALWELSADREQKTCSLRMFMDVTDDC